MTTVTWAWRNKVMKDYYLLPWLKFSKHFSGVKFWSYEFHWKDSRAWYTNFKRVVGASTGKGFKNTRLTLRLGKHIVVVGGIDQKRYYKDVHVIKVVNRGDVIYQYVPPLFGEQNGMMPMSVDAKPEDIKAAIIKQKNDYEHLDKAYPNNTWRN